MRESLVIMTLADTLQNLLFDNPNAGVQQLNECLKAAAALRGPAARAFTEAALGFCRRLYEADRSREALPIAEICAKLAARLRSKPLQIRAATARGNVLGDCGAQAAAMQQHVQVLQWAAAAGDARNMTLSLSNIGTIFLLAGKHQEAIQTYREIIYSELAKSDPGLLRDAVVDLSQCHLDLGEIDLGLSVIQRVFSPYVAVTSPLNAILAYRNHTRLLALAGQLDQAGQVLAEMEAFAAQHPSPRIAYTLLLTQGSYALACGQIDYGENLLLGALDLTCDTQHSVPDVLLALTRGLTQARCITKAEHYLHQLTEWVRLNHGRPTPTI